MAEADIAEWMCSRCVTERELQVDTDGERGRHSVTVVEYDFQFLEDFRDQQFLLPVMNFFKRDR